MGAIASQITSLTTVYSIFIQTQIKEKHQSSALLACVRGIHRWPMNSPHKWPVTRKMFPFDDVIMKTSASSLLCTHVSYNNPYVSFIPSAHCITALFMPHEHDARCRIIRSSRVGLTAVWPIYLELNKPSLLSNYASSTKRFARISGGVFFLRQVGRCGLLYFPDRHQSWRMGTGIHPSHWGFFVIWK